MLSTAMAFVAEDEERLKSRDFVFAQARWSFSSSSLDTSSCQACMTRLESNRGQSNRPGGSEHDVRPFYTISRAGQVLGKMLDRHYKLQLG